MAGDTNVGEVVQRALDDPDFGAELRDRGLRAIHAGAGSPEWVDFFSAFASDPDGLTAMGGDGAVACTCHSRTVTTTSTPLCTTTTTTTSN